MMARSRLISGRRAGLIAAEAIAGIAPPRDGADIELPARRRATAMPRIDAPHARHSIFVVYVTRSRRAGAATLSPISFAVDSLVYLP